MKASTDTEHGQIYFNQRVVSRDIKQTLQMSHNLRQENEEQKDIRYSIFQALIHHAIYLNIADIIVKAIDDLTHALKGRKNVKGNAQIEALEKNQ